MRVFFDVYATQSPWKHLDAVVNMKYTLIDFAFLQCWKIVACLFWRSLRGSCSESYHGILIGKWPSTVLLASQRAHTRDPLKIDTVR